MTHKVETRAPSGERIEDGQPNKPYWKRVHHDWRFWIAVILMLVAMGVYICTGDLAFGPTGPQQPLP